ncbi:MAG TPA: PEGA domain-containing protein [Bacteroidota bacterium]|nr:PEGA domain-containing protein [Bacteroidota bacterium]
MMSRQKPSKPSFYISVLSVSITVLLALACFTNAGRAQPASAIQRLRSEVDSLSVHRDDLRTYRIGSVPDSAFVFINNERTGRTPMTVTLRAGDSADVDVEFPGFQHWSSLLRGGSDSATDILAHLTRNQASVSVIVSPRNSSVTMDDSCLGTGSVFDAFASTGNHRFVVKNDSIGRALELVTSFQIPQRYFLRSEFNAFRPTRIIPMIFLPGVVQLVDRDYLKGSLMFVGTFALGYLAIRAHLDYSDRLDKYDAAISTYVTAQSELQADVRHQQVVDRKSDLDQYYARRAVFTALFAGAYACTLIDALLHHFTGDVLEVVPIRSVPGLDFPSDRKGVEVRVRP